jgi:hypothetical protein
MADLQRYVWSNITCLASEVESPPPLQEGPEGGIKGNRNYCGYNNIRRRFSGVAEVVGSRGHFAGFETAERVTWGIFGGSKCTFRGTDPLSGALVVVEYVRDGSSSYQSWFSGLHA